MMDNGLTGTVLQVHTAATFNQSLTLRRKTQVKPRERTTRARSDPEGRCREAALCADYHCHATHARHEIYVWKCHTTVTNFYYSYYLYELVQPHMILRIETTPQAVEGQYNSEQSCALYSWFLLERSSRTLCTLCTTSIKSHTKCLRCILV